MRLAELQREFFHTVTRSPGGSGARRQRPLVRGTPRFPAGARLQVYADMFLWRQVDALREDFPKLAAALGDERFFRLCQRYLQAHPSRDPSITRLGRGLPSFARTDRELRPGHRALAALEWARSEVFDEADAEPAGASALGALPPGALPELTLHLVPALRVVKLQPDVLPLWQALEDGAPAPRRLKTAVTAAVWRKDLRVYHVALAADEAAALRTAWSGAPLSRVCERFSGRRDPADAALEAIGSWFAEGWVHRRTFEERGIA